MFKKTILAVGAAVILTTGSAALQIDLRPFNADFNTLMTGIARDVAPSLRLGAVSGDLQGDATIDHFNFSVLSLSFTAADGLAKVLRPSTKTQWLFTPLPLSSLINDNLGSSDSVEKVIAYPSIKLGFGMAVGGGWDVSITGIWWPQVLADTAVNASGSDTFKQLKPQFSFANIGLQARKTVIEDSGLAGFIPAVSLGTGYHFSTFDLGVNLKSLKDLSIAAPSVGQNQTLDMDGKFGVTTYSNVVTLDLQVSKHLLVFTPYAKLTGAYQWSSFTGLADLKARVTDSSVPANNTTQDIYTHPTVNLSDFSFLSTTGLEINLFAVVFNFNIVADMGRAFLGWSSGGIEANAFSLNTGLRIAL